MPSSLNLSPTSVWFLPETENSLQYFNQGKQRNMYLLVLVLFDFEFHLEKVVESWYAASIRSLLENSPFVQRAVNIMQC